MKRTRRILVVTLAALCIASAILGLVYRGSIYREIPVEPGEPFGVGDVIGVLIEGLVFLFAGLTLAVGLLLLMVKHWRDVWYAVAACLVVIVVMVVYESQKVGAEEWFAGETGTYRPMNGDLVFQTSTSAQSLAIQEATGSPYSHMGIVYVEDGSPWVFEAGGTVTSTPWATWIGRGEGGHHVVKRLRDAETILTPAALGRMRAVGETLRGRSYDICFEWSDSTIYCSELVWKIYDRALGLQVGEPGTLADFDLGTATVQRIVTRRPECGLAPDEVVISPVAMFDSELLVTVFQK